MKRRPDTNNSMYSSTPCDKCGGPTLLLRTGSIWCAAEDPHPGGHFVFRIGMTPSAGAINTPARAIKPRVARVGAPARAREAKPVAPTFGGGYDDFVSGSDK